MHLVLKLSLKLALCLTLVLSACCSLKQPIALDSNELAQERLTSLQAPRGVIILVHGLNQRPSTLDPLASEFRSLGYHSYRLSLTGHDSIGKEIFPETDWERDLVSAYHAVQNRHPKLPIYLLGYSLGGLIVARVLDTNPDISPAGIILLAPALSLKLVAQLGYILNILPPVSLSVPNLAPPYYRRFADTPLFWYRNILKLYSKTRVLNNPSRLAAISTLIVANPRDELVSLCGLKSWLRDNQLSNNWRIESVEPKSKDKSIHQHVIIDQKSLGDAEWLRLLDILKDIAFSKSP